jgi:hypothetical protein
VRLVQRLLACLLVLLVVGESSGLARAFSQKSAVSCCCGSHWAARPCRCPDCPASARKRTVTPSGDHLLADHDCDGAGSDDATVLSVVAVVMAQPSAARAPGPVAALRGATVLVRSGRAVEVDRPPP